MIVEGDSLGVKPAQRRASGELEKGGVERAFTLVYEVERGASAAPSPSCSAVAEVGGGGGEGEGLGQEEAKEDVELGSKRKRKMANEGKRVRMRKSSRLVSEESEGKNEDEVAPQKRKAGTNKPRDTALHVIKGKEIHSQIEGLMEEREDMVHAEHVEYVEQKTPCAKPMLSAAVRDKLCGLQPLMQSHVTEKADPPAEEDDSWSIQCDQGMDTEREVEYTEDELENQKEKEPEAIASEGKRNGYILSWNKYTVDNILADQNAQVEAMIDYHASSPSPSFYTNARRDSGVALWRHCVDPQLLNTAPQPTLLLRGGEASTVVVSPPVYSCEQLQFGFNGQYEEREVYKTLGKELGGFGQQPGRAAKQAMEGIWNSVFQDIRNQGEGPFKSRDVAKAEIQLDLQLGPVDPGLPEEAEYPVLHFSVPSPFGGGARDEWYGESGVEDGWSSSASNETVEIPEPGSGKINKMVQSGEEWPEWDERDSPVWVEQDWGKWAGSVRGPYGEEGF